MPWTTGDVDQHIQGLTPKQKKRWVATANAVLAKTGDDGQAIRIANATAKGKKAK